MMYKIILIIGAMALAGCSAPVITDPLIVAHRGASYDAPENTMPAFMLAWEQGADAIEGDFHLTADGEIVCIHDNHTGRVADTSLVVSKSTLEELQELDVGSWKGDQWEGTKIPTIAEVFEIVPMGMKIYVEVKAGTEMLPKLYEEIERSPLIPDQIVIISFNSDVVKEFKAARPMHEVFWLSGFREDEEGNIIPDTETILETLKETGADGFSSHYGLADPEMIDTIIEEGYEYHVWTVNDVSVAWDFKQYGASSVTTDMPGLIRDFFQERAETSDN
ncbi:MAG: glycerophosphodiester phosphodiesterase [Bacteroidales bacterium]